jgi:hypothetical protein
MSNKVYDILKYVVIIVLPALSVLYVTLAGVWGWPYATEVSSTLDAITVFMAAVLMISTAQYNKKVNTNG